MRKILSTLIVFLVCSCVNYESPLDKRFGEIQNNYIKDQTLNPNTSRQDKKEYLTDGLASKSSIDRYQKSFELPPVSTNVFNLGLGSGSQTSGH